MTGSNLDSQNFSPGGGLGNCPAQVPKDINNSNRNLHYFLFFSYEITHPAFLRPDYPAQCEMFVDGSIYHVCILTEDSIAKLPFKALESLLLLNTEKTRS